MISYHCYIEKDEYHGHGSDCRFSVLLRVFWFSVVKIRLLPKAMSHKAIFLATQWRCIASCKEDFLVWHPMSATSLATKNCVACCRESRSSFYFSQCYATSCSVWHPHCKLSRTFFEKEPITIRHKQNAADIFKYWASVKYNLTAGHKTSCVRLTS